MADSRAEVVQRRIRSFLDSRASGSRLRIVSVGAGCGRDLLPVLAIHPGRAGVRARLVEPDLQELAAASDAVSELKLDWNVEIVCGDGSTTDAYAGAVPADLVLLCGVFGRIPPDDVRNTIEYLPQLCARNATVISTHDAALDLRDWFQRAGFEDEDGVERFAGETRPLARGVRLFTFPR